MAEYGSVRGVWGDSHPYRDHEGKSRKPSSLTFAVHG